MWDPSITSDSDKVRWFDQGIHAYNMSNQKGETVESLPHHSWGIIQTQGGPCGLLAVIQGELIRVLNLYEDIDRKVSPTEAVRALCEGLGMILARSAIVPAVDDGGATASASASASARRDKCVKLILPNSDDTGLSMADFEPSSSKFKCVYVRHDATSTPDSKRPKGSSDVDQTDIQKLAEAIAAYLLENDHIDVFHKPCGVMLFLLSLVEARGVECIKAGELVNRSFIFSQTLA